MEQIKERIKKRASLIASDGAATKIRLKLHLESLSLESFNKRNNTQRSFEMQSQRF